MDYRKDVQILRGISVLLVVLFHLEIGGIESGFLGVDIFFVISGFLMAILYDSNDKIAFYSRRARRLLPAYLVTILVTLLISLFITTPLEFASVSSQSLFALIFSSNIGFWFENSYFSKAEFKPLLHLWSLGVEIQFYLFIPFFVYFFKKGKLFLPVFAITSFILCLLVLTKSPKTSFFIMPLRLWEFLIGYCAAYYFTNSGNLKYKSKRKCIGLFSLILIISIPFMSVDGSALSVIFGHPGLFSLLVTMATALFLVFGIPKIIENNIIGHGLEKVGKYSYSIYLAHFPIIVLFLYKPFQGTVLKAKGWGETLSLIALIMLFSVLLFKYIESSSFFKNRKSGGLTIILSTLLISLLGANFQSKLYTDEELKIFSAWEDRSEYRCGKLIRITDPSAKSCFLNSEVNTKSTVLFVGNSHADSIKNEFVNVATKLNVGVWFMVENNPLMSGGIIPEDLILEALKRKANRLVLHFSPGAVSTDVIEELIERAARENIKVDFIMPVPVWGKHIPKALYNSLHYSSEIPVQHITSYQNNHLEFLTDLKKIKTTSLKIFEVGNIFCKPFCLLKNDDGDLLYFDESHLTITGSKLLNELLKEVLITRANP